MKIRSNSKFRFSKFFPKRSKKIGKTDGKIHYTGDKSFEEVSIDIIDYSKENFLEEKSVSLDNLSEYANSKNPSWINVVGVHNTKIIEEIGKKFGVHQLVLEDIASVNQRAKIESYEDMIFIVLRMLSYEPQGEIKNEQVSLILGNNFVITFLEDKGDVFDSLRSRIKNPKSKLRKFGPDYLVYAIIDTIVDNYFIVLEKLGERIEELEQEVLSSPTQETQKEIYRLKRELIILRKSVWPLRDLIGPLYREDSDLITSNTTIYFRDVYDHTIQVIDTLETFRDLLSGMIDSYLSAQSNKMNEIMKVLTIISTIFIPLTFIVGVYGMNFHYFPELDIKWFYPALWGAMIFIALFMIFFFKRKKWI